MLVFADSGGKTTNKWKRRKRKVEIVWWLLEIQKVLDPQHPRAGCGIQNIYLILKKGKSSVRNEY